MRYLIFVSILFAAFTTFGFSQKSETKEKECPKFNVTGPSAVIRPGETITFALNAFDSEGLEIKEIKWSVDKGTIIAGQGKHTVIVAGTENLLDETVTAQVEIKTGLNCIFSGKETGMVAVGFHPHPQDEFGDISDDDIKARIDNLFIEVQYSPNSIGYIVSYGPRTLITKRQKIIQRHIKFRKFDLKRIVFINGGKEKKIRSRFWVLPSEIDPELIN